MRALIALAAALALAPVARGATIHLGWTENYYYHGNVIEHLFVVHVESVTVGRDSWTVKGSVANTSALRMTIRNRFALVAGSAVFPATRFSPSLPPELAIGGKWTGSFGGAGKLPRTTTLRVRFGSFKAPLLPGVPGITWLTRHSFRL